MRAHCGERRGERRASLATGKLRARGRQARSLRGAWTVRGEGVGAGAWDSAGNACAAYVGEWGASLAAGELWAMCERRVQVRTGGGARRARAVRRARAMCVWRVRTDEPCGG